MEEARIKLNSISQNQFQTVEEFKGEVFRLVALSFPQYEAGILKLVSLAHFAQRLTDPIALQNLNTNLEKLNIESICDSLSTKYVVISDTVDETDIEFTDNSGTVLKEARPVRNSHEESGENVQEKKIIGSATDIQIIDGGQIKELRSSPDKSTSDMKRENRRETLFDKQKSRKFENENEECGVEERNRPWKQHTSRSDKFKSAIKERSNSLATSCTSNFTRNDKKNDVRTTNKKRGSDSVSAQSSVNHNKSEHVQDLPTVISRVDNGVTRKGRNESPGAEGHGPPRGINRERQSDNVNTVTKFIQSEGPVLTGNQSNNEILKIATIGKIMKIGTDSAGGNLCRLNKGINQRYQEHFARSSSIARAQTSSIKRDRSPEDSSTLYENRKFVLEREHIQNSYRSDNTVKIHKPESNQGTESGSDVKHSHVSRSSEKNDIQRHEVRTTTYRSVCSCAGEFGNKCERDRSSSIALEKADDFFKRDPDAAIRLRKRRQEDSEERKNRKERKTSRLEGTTGIHSNTKAAPYKYREPLLEAPFVPIQNSHISPEPTFSTRKTDSENSSLISKSGHTASTANNSTDSNLAKHLHTPQNISLNGVENIVNIDVTSKCGLKSALNPDSSSEFDRIDQRIASSSYLRAIAASNEVRVVEESGLTDKEIRDQKVRYKENKFLRRNIAAEWVLDEAFQALIGEDQTMNIISSADEFNTDCRTNIFETSLNSTTKDDSISSHCSSSLPFTITTGSNITKTTSILETVPTALNNSYSSSTGNILTAKKHASYAIGETFEGVREIDNSKEIEHRAASSESSSCDAAIQNQNANSTDDESIKLISQNCSAGKFCSTANSDQNFDSDIVRESTMNGFQLISVTLDYSLSISNNRNDITTEASNLPFATSQSTYIETLPHEIIYIKPSSSSGTENMHTSDSNSVLLPISSTQELHTSFLSPRTEATQNERIRLTNDYKAMPDDEMHSKNQCSEGTSKCERKIMDSNPPAISDYSQVKIVKSASNTNKKIIEGVVKDSTDKIFVESDLFDPIITAYSNLSERHECTSEHLRNFDDTQMQFGTDHANDNDLQFSGNDSSTCITFEAHPRTEIVTPNPITMTNQKSEYIEVSTSSEQKNNEMSSCFVIANEILRTQTFPDTTLLEQSMHEGTQQSGLLISTDSSMSSNLFIQRTQPPLLVSPTNQLTQQTEPSTVVFTNTHEFSKMNKRAQNTLSVECDLSIIPIPNDENNSGLPISSDNSSLFEPITPVPISTNVIFENTIATPIVTFGNSISVQSTIDDYHVQESDVLSRALRIAGIQVENTESSTATNNTIAKYRSLLIFGPPCPYYPPGLNPTTVVIPVNISGIDFPEAIIDSGSNMSLMSSELYWKVDKGLGTKYPAPKSLLCINGQNLDVEFWADVPIRLGIFRENCPFLIASNLSVGLIIGADLLRKFKVHLDFEHDTLWVGEWAIQFDPEHPHPASRMRPNSKNQPIPISARTRRRPAFNTERFQRFLANSRSSSRGGTSRRVITNPQTTSSYSVGARVYPFGGLRSMSSKADMSSSSISNLAPSSSASGWQNKNFKKPSLTSYPDSSSSARQIFRN